MCSTCPKLWTAVPLPPARQGKLQAKTMAVCSVCRVLELVQMHINAVAGNLQLLPPRMCIYSASPFPYCDSVKKLSRHFLLGNCPEQLINFRSRTIIASQFLFAESVCLWKLQAVFCCWFLIALVTVACTPEALEGIHPVLRKLRSENCPGPILLQNCPGQLINFRSRTIF